MPPHSFANAGQLVELLARERRAARAASARTTPPASAAPLKTPNSEPRTSVGDVGDLHAEAQVGLVGSVPQHRLVPGDLRERPRQLDALHLLPDLAVQALDQVEDLVALDERHLDVELRELELAVGALGLVPEAAGDLVVPLEAAHHVELLEQLRALRQRVERAGVQPRRHQEVARALGRRLGQHRRLEVVEAAVLEVAAHDLRDVRARAQPLRHLVAAQVERAVADAQRLVDALVVELERQRVRRRQHLERLAAQLDLAGREARVDGLGRAPRDGRPRRARPTPRAWRARPRARRERPTGRSRPARRRSRRARRGRSGRRGRGGGRRSRRRRRARRRVRAPSSPQPCVRYQLTFRSFR